MPSRPGIQMSRSTRSAPLLLHLGQGGLAIVHRADLVALVAQDALQGGADGALVINYEYMVAHTVS